MIGRLSDNDLIFVFTLTADPRKFDSVLPNAEYMIDTAKIYP
ncbi:hypothetical protein BH18THE2_BH18THE2_38270 [soil metagenome]